MQNPFYAVYGSSGYGRQVMPLAREQLKKQNIDSSRLVFIDDKPEASIINGHKVLSYEEFLSTDASSRYITIAIANSKTRQNLAEKIYRDNINPWSVFASNVVILDNAEIGEGTILSPFVTMNSNIKVGKHFHANLYSFVGHDSVIGDYVTFAPGVKCNGNIVIEDYAYIGTGVVFKQGKPGEPLVIGRGAVVGMGAVVTKNVPAGATVVGNPAKPLVKN
ncbi:acetyltransferase [Advenella sp. RU8]|uniref:acetyltransferase n=1 Tax=Advenella sp. RU8 TaxID=3399575 RepID=UPI003AAA719E